MSDINLLPVTTKNQNGTTRIASAAKKIGIIASVVIFLIVLVVAGIYGFFYVNGTVTTSSITTVEDQIKAQEVTEQKIVLLRDRVAKASNIINNQTSDNNINAFNDILSHVPEGVSLQEVKVLPAEMTVIIEADQSRQITEFIRILTESGKYAQIETTSMDFSSKDRYHTSFRLVLGQVQ
jgi:Tfp pilus assembly protein PilN